MMPGKGLLGRAALAISLVAYAAPAAALEFDCDVPANRFSSVVDDGDSLPSIQAKVEKLVFRADDYLPLAALRISNGDDSRSVSLQLVAPNNRARQFDVFLSLSTGGAPNRTLLGRIDIDGPIELKLFLAEDGSINVQVGSFTATRDFGPLEASTAAALCSSGQFKFSDLSFRQTS